MCKFPNNKVHFADKNKWLYDLIGFLPKNRTYTVYALVRICESYTQLASLLATLFLVISACVTVQQIFKLPDCKLLDDGLFSGVKVILVVDVSASTSLHQDECILANASCVYHTLQFSSLQNVS